MRKLNILTITQVYYPDSTGGSERVIYEISKRLAKRGHKVHVVTKRTEKDLPSREIVERVNIHRYGDPSLEQVFSSTLVCFLGSRRLFTHLVKERHFDVVVYHHFSVAFGCLSHRFSKTIPSIFTFYASYYKEFPYGEGILNQLRPSFLRRRIKPPIEKVFLRFHNFQERFCLNKCDRIMVLSKFSEAQLQELYPTPSPRISIIPGGVDTREFHPTLNKDDAREKIGLSDDKFVILTVRRFIPRMGLCNLIEAMQTVVKKHPESYLIIGGKGVLRPQLEQQIDRLGLGKHVRLIGFIPHEMLPSFYQAADLFVLPTLTFEGFGMATLEALACGTPVVGTRVGATPEILSKLSWDFVLDSTEPESIAGGIVDFIDRYRNDDGLRQRCFDLARPNYDWDNIVPRVEQLYYEVAEGK